MNCIYENLPAPAAIVFTRMWCGQCSWVVPNDVSGTYVRDIVRDGKMYHLVELDSELVCPQCGHSTRLVYRLCGCGNKAESVAKWLQKPQPQEQSA